MSDALCNVVIPAKRSAERESRGTHRPCGWIPDSLGGGSASRMTGRGIHHACSVGAHLSPHPWRCGSIGVPLPATGRGWAHPSSWQRAAPGRRAEWLEIQEARCNRFRRSASNGAEPATALAAQGAIARSGNWSQPEAKACTGTQIAARGCRKATQGPEQGLREPDGVPREAQPAPPGRVVPAQGCRRGTRVPVAPAGTSLRGGRRVGVADDKWGTRPELVEGRPRTPSVVRRAHHGIGPKLKSQREER